MHRRLSPEERAEWFARGADPDRPRLGKGAKAADRARLQRIVFDRMGYDDKLRWCDRPEHLDGPCPDAWKAVNRHLGTSAASLPELVRALGERRFGRVPRVGDAFCGGGSVPFEAARLGCEAQGSDLNPVAALLTWGALNIVGGGEEVAERIRAAQTEVFEAVDRQVAAWRIEHDEAGWRADAFLWCTETDCIARRGPAVLPVFDCGTGTTSRTIRSGNLAFVAWRTGHGRAGSDQRPERLRNF